MTLALHGVPPDPGMMRNSILIRSNTVPKLDQIPQWKGVVRDRPVGGNYRGFIRAGHRYVARRRPLSSRMDAAAAAQANGSSTLLGLDAKPSLMALAGRCGRSIQQVRFSQNALTRSGDSSWQKPRAAVSGSEGTVRNAPSAAGRVRPSL